MGDMDAEGIATTLRQLVDSSPISGVIQNLNDLGITSNGTDNTLSTSSYILNDALSNNLTQVSQLFSDPASGLASTVASYLDKTLASNGIVASKEQSFTNQYSALTTSITNLQTKITSDESEMQTQFVAMEDAINSINVEKQYLTAYFNSTATTTDAPTAATSSSSNSSSSSAA
jgi:flagellar capping protein FliD